MRLEGKVGLITGAATEVKGELMGFGGATAWLFSGEGAKMVVTDINETSGEKTAAQIREAGGEGIFVRLDVTKEQDWADAIQTTVSTYGKLDILVNNAGIGAASPLEETTVDQWDLQLDVMAKGTFLGTKHAIPEMRRAGGGSIVNVSSIFGMVGSLADSVYTAAKGAVRTFTKSTAVQYAKEGIRVNSVHPGWALTPLSAESFSDPAVLNPKLATVPMGRLATVDEVAYGILYLASDEASFVTGVELVIDGGRIA